MRKRLAVVAVAHDPIHGLRRCVRNHPANLPAAATQLDLRAHAFLSALEANSTDAGG
jgi:hypothetical protein